MSYEKWVTGWVGLKSFDLICYSYKVLQLATSPVPYKKQNAELKTLMNIYTLICLIM